jgi:hypothetical protein
MFTREFLTDENYVQGDLTWYAYDFLNDRPKSAHEGASISV